MTRPTSDTRDDIIGAWLEAGPVRLPSGARSAMLAGVFAGGQSRGPRQRARVWRAYAMSAALAAVVTVAVVAGLLVFDGVPPPSGPGTIPQASALPTAPEAQSPTPSPSAIAVRPPFGVPFEFVPPAGSTRGRPQVPGLVVFIYGSDAGISVWDVRRLVADPCTPDGPTKPVTDGAAGLVAELEANRHIRIVDRGQGAVDGRPVTRLRLALTEDPPCDVLHLWIDETTGATMNIPVGHLAELTILDVEGRLVVLEAFAEAEHDEWFPIADASIRSIRFLGEPPPSP